MAKSRRRGRAQQSSDDGESSGDESACGVEELDLEQLRRKLRQYPKKKQWPGRDEEIHACEESVRKKKDLPWSAAMTANGCCMCFSVHLCLAVFGLLTAGLLLTAVGATGTAPGLAAAGVAPGLAAAGVFQKYPCCAEYVATKSGELVEMARYLGKPDGLTDFSREKVEARAAKENPDPEPEPEPEPEPSGEEEGEFECQKGCGRCFTTLGGRATHEARYCTGPVEEGVDYEAETAAARALLDGLDLKNQEIVDVAAVGDVDGVTRGPGNDELLLEKVHGEVVGLKGAKLGAKLRTVDVALATAASDAQRRDAYVLARVKRLVEPVLLARKYFYKNGEFQRSQCQAYVRGLQGARKKSRSERLKAMIKGLDEKNSFPRPCTLSTLEAALVEAYEAKTPEVAEASTYDPLAAPEIKKVIAEHGEQLRGGANDDAVLKAVEKTATGFLQQTKGGFMATNGSVVYVQTVWLIRLILSGRKVRTQNGKIFEAFKADTEGKRNGYVEADGWRTAVNLKEAERVPYNQSERFDEARHTLGEVVYGGNGTDGFSIVCFIIEGRKYFVLFNGREDFVLVNEVTMACLAFVAATVVPIVLVETSSRLGDANYNALASDKLPRLKDILASEQDEQLNRHQFRGKWNAMTGFFDGFFALVLLAIAEKGGTITSAPGRLSAVAGEVPKQGESGGTGPKDHTWHFDEEQVENLVLRLRGGGSGMCGGRSGNGGRDSDDDGAAAPTGSGPSGRGRAKRPKYDPFEGLDPWTPWNANQVLVGVDGPGDGSGAG